MTRNFKIPVVASTVAAVLISIGAPVMAEPSFSTGRINVDYRDIDLSTANGQVKLQNRMDAAVHELCGAPVFGTREEDEMLKQCRDDARANAEPQIRSILTAASMKYASNH